MCMIRANFRRAPVCVDRCVACSTAHHSTMVRGHADAAAAASTNALRANHATTVRPVVDVIYYNKFLLTARVRSVKQQADTFVSRGRNVFVPYVRPQLEQRHAQNPSSGHTKKRYYTRAARLWQQLEEVQYDERFWWWETRSKTNSRLFGAGYMHASGVSG
jgi:ATP/maltotriose-dependent transcriptional regulator MalT